MKKNGYGQVEILIAEDSATQAEQLKQLLEEHQYSVTTAVNGKDALVQLALRQPTIVISDVMMPELDGYGLCKAIKSDDKLKHIPVMLVTTLSDPADVIRGLECGADNFIRKPYEEKYLLSRIDYLLMNVELRKNQRMQMALEIYIGGKKHFINAERQQILDLLVSTYEQAVQVNSELKEKEKELTHSNLVLQGLNRIAEGLNAVVSEREVAETALHRAMELPGVQAGWIFLRTGETGFRLAAARGLPPALSGPEAFDSDCACRRKLLSGELDLATNIVKCERLAAAKGDSNGLCCHASVPLWLGEGHLMGVMNLAGLGEGLFNEDQLKVLFSVGNQVAVALERARLHENLETLVEERTAKLIAEVEERKRIEQEQARLVAIIEATPDLIGTATLDGRLLYTNQAGLRMMGIKQNDLPSLRIADVHPEWAGQLVLEVGIPHALSHGCWSGETAILGADGHEIPVLQVILAHRGADGTMGYLSTIARDITQRKKNEARIARLNRVYVVLSHINATIIRVRNEDELFGEACRIAVEHGQFAFAWIGRFDADSREVTPVAQAGHNDGYLAQINLIADEGIPGSCALTTQALAEMAPAVCNDIASDERMAPWRSAALGRGYRSVTVFPLVRDGQPFGVFALYATETDTFDSEEMKLLIEMSGDISYALENLRLEARRKQVEDELRKLSLAVEQSPNSVVITDLDENIEYVNEGFVKATGYSREEAIGQTPRILYSGKTPPESYLDMWSHLTRGEVWKGEFINRRKDGSEFIESIFVSPVHDADGGITHYLAIKEDITERTRSQEAQARLAAIIEATPDMVATSNPDGRVLYYNRAGRQLLGLTADEDASAIWVRETHPEWAAKRVLEEGIPYAIAHGTWSGETSLLRRDGMEIPVSQVIVSHRGADGKVEFLSTIVRDISLRVQAEQTIHEALATLDASDDAVYIFDPDTLRFTYVNEGAVRQVGYTRDELLGMTPQGIKPDYDEVKFRKMLASMIQGERHTFRYLTVNRHKDGHDISVEVNFQYVAPEGEKPRFIAIARDVTEQQRNLRKLERVKSELESANAALEDERAHLAERVVERTAELTVANEELAQAKTVAEEASRAKSAFLATMSHEIRTPMNGVVGMVDVLAQSKLSEHQVELVKTIRESGNALLHIIDDILDFSKIEAGRLEFEREPLSMADLIEGLCNSLLPVATHRGVELDLFVSPDIPELVLSDDVRLRQLLYNLLGNAIKFSTGRPGKRGRVAVRVVAIANTVPLRLALSVADNGIGMSPETVRSLFTPFTQAEISTTRRFGGTGLGLAICKRLTDLMQGEISVESTLGTGSTFTVTLPFEVPDEQPVRSLPDISGLDCIVLKSEYLRADDLRAYLEYASARVQLSDDAATAAEIASRLTSPVVVILEAEHQAASCVQPAFARLPNVRHLLITRGRRRRARVEDSVAVTLDGDALRRLVLLRAVAVAAGRASPEVFHERSTEVFGGDEETAPTIADARAQGLLILVAEDDEINQKVILQQLALLGYAAEIAGNGAEALRLWRDGNYALLLTDLHMPEMDGYTLTENIRREEAGRSRIPILALTANALRGEANRALVAGMDEYLTKPVLLPTLRNMLEKWLPHSNEPLAATVQKQKPGRRKIPTMDVAILKGLVGDNPDIVAEFLNDYLASVRRLAKEIHSALAGGDAAHVGAIAHKIKSSSRSVGALALGDLCAEIENSGKTGDKAAIARSMVKFDIALAKVEDEIHKFLTKP